MTNYVFRKKRWHTLKDKKVFETPIFNLHIKKCAPEKGEKAGDFYVLHAPEWINVIAITGDQKIILVEQYRHGIDEPTLEIPGGMVDPGEKPLESAKRELEEETGYTSGSWNYMGKVSSNPAILTNYTHLYLAENCRQTNEQKTDGFEDIYSHVMDMDRFLKYVNDGVVHHSIVLAAVAKYLLLEKG